MKRFGLSRVFSTKKWKFWLTGWPVEDHSVGWFCVLHPRLGHMRPSSCDKSGLHRPESRMPSSVQHDQIISLLEAQHAGHACATLRCAAIPRESEGEPQGIGDEG